MAIETLRFQPQVFGRGCLAAADGIQNDITPFTRWGPAHAGDAAECLHGLRCGQGGFHQRDIGCHPAARQIMLLRGDFAPRREFA